MPAGKAERCCAPWAIQPDNPEGTSIVGLAHDHPGTGYGAYDFSVGQPGYDIDVLSAAGYYGFLATQPIGRVLMFNPVAYNNWFYGQGNGPAVCVLQGSLMGGTPCP